METNFVQLRFVFVLFLFSCFTLDCFPHHFTKSFIFKLPKIFQIFWLISSCRSVFSLIDPAMCILPLSPILGVSSHSGWIQGGCDESTQPVWCFSFYISTNSPVAGSSHKIVFAEGTVENFLTTVPRDPKEFDWLLFKSPNFGQFKLFLEEINIQVFLRRFFKP